MLSLKQRSYQKELLDDAQIPFEDIKRNMQELAVINQKLGGHAITIKGLQIFLNNQDKNVVMHIVEIGCGGGDNLRAIKKWADKKKMNLQLTGIDINIECIAYAESLQENKGINFIYSDYKTIDLRGNTHIIFSSLFCHHFTDEELVFMLKWMKQNSTLGFFINDLHRNPFAYYSIKLLTHFLSKSYLVKNDAPLSVKRGFKKEDWDKIFGQAKINDFSCRWKWAFRWLVIFKK
jgi:2-polyprenyl-3-methyl-5-hydroxy-6-metoxy-1,4-benzoquinol methylase